MTDDPTVTPDPEARPAGDSGAETPPSAETNRSAGEAWADVVVRMNELGMAVTTWTKAAADNPDNRRHLDDVRNGVNDMAKQADAAFSRVTSAEFSQQVKSGAGEAGQAIGGAAQKVSDAAAPHVATAFSGIAGVFGRAAQKVEEAAARQKEHVAAAGATAPPAPEAATSAHEAAAPPAPPSPPTPPASEE